MFSSLSIPEWLVLCRTSLLFLKPGALEGRSKQPARDESGRVAPRPGRRGQPGGGHLVNIGVALLMMIPGE